MVLKHGESMNSSTHVIQFVTSGFSFWPFWDCRSSLDFFRFEAVAAVSMMPEVFWVVIPCSLIEGSPEK